MDVASAARKIALKEKVVFNINKRIEYDTKRKNVNNMAGKTT